MQKMTSKQNTWQKRVDDWSTSGLSQVDYCRRHGIHPKRFYSWKKRLEKLRCVPVDAGSFLPVTLVAPISEHSTAPVVLRVNGIEIQYTHETDETLLLKVVSLLESRA